MKESSDLVDVVFDLNMSILLVEMLQGCAQTASRLLAVFGFVRPREQIDINNELPCSSSRQLLELQQKVLMETCKKTTTTTTTLMAADASAAVVAAVVDDDNLAAACCRVVLERLGMGASMSVGSDHQGAERSRRMEGGGGGVREIIMELLEEKEASMEELKEAFYVFDRNEDGYVTAEELWGVMRRLGLNEGLRLEDCRRMIAVYDQDGDGRISFHEFTLGINTVS